MHEMLSLPRFLSLFISLASPAKPAIRLDRSTKRRRAIEALRLSPHILRDVGMDDYEGAANDPRWLQQIDRHR